MEQSIVKPTKQDLDFYLQVLENKRIKLAGTDTSEENNKLLSAMAWDAIQKYHDNESTN